MMYSLPNILSALGVVGSPTMQGKQPEGSEGH